MLYTLTLAELVGKGKLRGIKAKHIPYELTDGGWEKNPGHEEEVTLLEYKYEYIGGVIMEGILFIRSDFTLDRDRLDSFIVLE